jgi:hypothetical protein
MKKAGKLRLLVEVTDNGGSTRLAAARVDGAGSFHCAAELVDSFRVGLLAMLDQFEDEVGFQLPASITIRSSLAAD